MYQLGNIWEVLWEISRQAIKTGLLVDFALEQVLAPADQAVEEQQTVEVIQFVLNSARLKAFHLKTKRIAFAV